MKNISGPPPEGTTTLTRYRGLCGEMILRAMLAVALPLVGTRMSGQVRGDDPNLQFWVWAWG